jgi:aspartate 1-decarboxylase
VPHRFLQAHGDFGHAAGRQIGRANLDIDCELLQASGIRPYERVQVVDVDNGERLETYAIAGPAGSGAIELNGAAARLVSIGDKVIIMAYAQVAEPLPDVWSPVVLIMGEGNRIAEVRHAENPSEMCC